MTPSPLSVAQSIFLPLIDRWRQRRALRRHSDELKHYIQQQEIAKMQEEIIQTEARIFRSMAEAGKPYRISNRRIECALAEAKRFQEELNR